jgi:hypothetical protein
LLRFQPGGELATRAIPRALVVTELLANTVSATAANSVERELDVGAQHLDSTQSFDLHPHSGGIEDNLDGPRVQRKFYGCQASHGFLCCGGGRVCVPERHDHGMCLLRLAVGVAYRCQQCFTSRRRPGRFYVLIELG